MIVPKTPSHSMGCTGVFEEYVIQCGLVSTDSHIRWYPARRWSPEAHSRWSFVFLDPSESYPGRRCMPGPRSAWSGWAVSSSRWSYQSHLDLEKRRLWLPLPSDRPVQGPYLAVIKLGEPSCINCSCHFIFIPLFFSTSFEHSIFTIYYNYLLS